MDFGGIHAMPSAKRNEKQTSLKKGSCILIGFNNNNKVHL